MPKRNQLQRLADDHTIPTPMNGETIMKRLLLSMLITGLVGSFAFGQQRQPPGQRLREGQMRTDNRQGPLDPLEKAIDADGDGIISAEEIANASQRLKALDSDEDGTVSAEEIRTAMRAAFREGRTGGPGGGGAPNAASRPGSAGSSTLERAGLKIGQPVPNLTIHDDKGGSFRMADVKGKYTVIVFGCLT